MLIEKLDGLIQTNHKSGEMVRVNVLRSIKNELVRFEKEGKTLTEVDEVNILLKMKSRYEDSMDTYKSANRMDIYESEKAEYDILMEYIPKQPTNEEIIEKTKEIVNEIIATNGSISMKDMRVVLSKVNEVYPNAKGDIVSKVVREMSK